MKKLGYFMGAALLTLGSCTNEINEEGFVDKAKTISFNAYSNKTRAMTGDVTSENIKGDNFGVFGYYNNSPYLYVLENTTKKAVKQKWNSTSSNWEYVNPSELKFWPDGSMDFYAYFPSSENVTFEESNANANSNVMTISNVDCSHDVLFAYQGSQEKTVRVPLTFNHAFSKIKGLIIEMPEEGSLFKSNCQVEVQKVEFINTDTKGNVKVNNSGKASYSVNPSNVTLRETLDPVVTINNTNAIKYLINNGTNAKGYLFATNSSETNYVTGTGKTMWDGTKNLLTAGTTLENLGQVCLKLTCKVWNGADSKKYYYVGGDEDNYGEVYIPLTGNASNSNSVSTLDAGKRYTYKIVMKDNVGYTNEGDPILTPILFNVSSVSDWSDVNVTIKL